jgi:adenine-specific DNA-methyltransferase
MRAGYGRNTRELLTTQATPLQVLDFGDLPVFEEATTYPSIVMVGKTPLVGAALRGRPKSGQPHGVAPTKPEFLTATFTNAGQLERLEETLASIGFTMPVTALNLEGWTLERPEVLGLMEKLKKAGKPLGEYVEGKFYRGVTTGCNEAFVIDDEERLQLISEDPKSSEIIKPWLRGRDIQKWKAKWEGLSIIFTRRGTNIDQYPAVKRYLAQFQADLVPKVTGKEKQGRKPGPYMWFEIQDNIAYFEEFETSKIIYPDIAQHSKFTWDESNAYLGNTAYIIPSNEKWLVGLLNSKLIWWLYVNVSPMIQGGFVRFISQYMEQLPIPNANQVQKAPIVDLVQKTSPIPPALMSRTLSRRLTGWFMRCMDLRKKRLRWWRGKPDLERTPLPPILVDLNGRLAA